MARQQQHDLLILGQAVRELRVQRHRSIRNLATLCGVSPGRLAALEAGRLDPDFKLLDTLAHGLGVSRTEIVVHADRLAGESPSGPLGEQAP